MSCRWSGLAIAFGLSIACGTSAREASPRDTAGSEVAIEWAAPRRLELNSPLNEVLKCEPSGLKVTPAPAYPGIDEPKRVTRFDAVTVSLRCTNHGSKSIRAARGTLSVEGVFGEALVLGSFEHVWDRIEAVDEAEVAEFALAPMRASAPLDSPAGRFLRSATLDDVGRRQIDITHLVFVDGSESRRERGEGLSQAGAQEVP